MTSQYNEFKLGDEVTVKGVTINFKPIVGKIVDKNLGSGEYHYDCQYKVCGYWWGGSMLELVER